MRCVALCICHHSGPPPACCKSVNAHVLMPLFYRPDHLPPSQGGKYVGFGSAPSMQPQQNNNSQARFIVALRTCGHSQVSDAHYSIPQLLDELSTTVSHGLSRLTVAASSVASATVATVKPGLQEVSQRYQRGELAESAASLVATGADLGLKGLTNLKGLLKTAVSQIDSYASGSALASAGSSSFSSDAQQPPQAWQQQQQTYQAHYGDQYLGAGGRQPPQRATPSASGGWNGWDEPQEDEPQRKPQTTDAPGPSTLGGSASAKDKWAGWDNTGNIPDDVWDADWGK